MNRNKQKQLNQILTPIKNSWDARFAQAQKQENVKFKAQGNNFVLMSETAYGNLQEQISALQDSVKSLLSTLEPHLQDLPSPKRDHGTEDEDLVKSIAKKH